ncbi:aspartyl/asparaginyl beta-hydroxylase domain-containing protein [Sphingomonas phyllosphaerae]|uniref:aspartyl/asparaginyl beta-hydroxylase domain-containing protein n=1 Tax=Sphingomonas phyllosphaerae TaxID=257003 RepID=UPI0003B74480|nr:aspartyl/asparaginyl beta-hydroxylase domain-containing protein [Sphingomonas phyllosphaerae]
MADRQEQEARAQAGWAAWQRGDAVAARAAFEEVAQAGAAAPSLWLLLAHARIATGADEGSVRAALDQVLAADPRNVAALVLRGDHAEDDRAACSFYALALSGASEAARGQPPLAAAQAKLQAAAGRFTSHLRACVADAAAGERFDEAVALVTGEKQLFLQQPTSFFFPGLPHRQFFDPVEFEWAPALAAAAPAIRAELDALIAGGTGSAPYVQAAADRANRGHALLNDARWSAFHLIENGTPHALNAPRCPETLAALSAAPLPHIPGRSPMALFSVLRPHTHIPAHNGMLNTRLIVHLPLIVPDGCRLRVGNEVRSVRAGELMIFDDSIEHEAWNDSDEPRVVLLFEVWRPELTAAERAGLVTLFGSIGLYAGGQ